MRAGARADGDPGSGDQACRVWIYDRREKPSTSFTVSHFVYIPASSPFRLTIRHPVIVLIATETSGFWLPAHDRDP